MGVTLINDTAISSGTVTVPDGVILETGPHTLTVNQGAELSVAGIVSVTGTFNMEGTLSVDTNGEIGVGQNGMLIFAATRTGGGDLKGTISIMDGGISKDLKGNADGTLWNEETGRTVFHAGAKGYSGGDDDDDLLIGTADDDDPDTTYITLTSGTFTSSTIAAGGYTLAGNATLNRTFGLDDQTLTIVDGTLTVHIQVKETTEADGLWLIKTNAKIVGEGTATIVVEDPENNVPFGFIFLSENKPTNNFYDSTGGAKIPTANPHTVIGEGTYDWDENLGGEGGWKQRQP
jgi:hypothetical protein